MYVKPGSLLTFYITRRNALIMIPTVTPGEILLENFLQQMGITALRLSRYSGNSADFWLGIQDEFDLREQQ
jgi:plasmid maintenance system antidote protein VapI